MLSTQQRFFNWVHIFITNSNKYNFIKSTNIVVCLFVTTEGPLPNTKGDFWQMVWEQQAYVVFMATR